MSTRPIQLGITTIILLLFVILIPSVSSMPPSPELLERLKASGEWDALAQRLAEARARGVDAPNLPADQYRGVGGRALEIDPNAVDTFRVLVILADFSDNEAEAGPVYGTPADFEHLLFSFDEHDNHFSMSEHYYENSYGGFYLEGVVAGWYKLPQTYAYYVDGNNGFNSYPRNAQGMAQDAILMSDVDVDYSQFDNDGDGWMDGVFVVHAGPGAEQTGDPNHIWSHKWSLPSTLNLDGIWVSTYTTEPEESQGVGLSTMGVYAHEYGHFIGLPDLYDTDYSSSGVGAWSLMSGGSWNLGGRYPAFMDAWCKTAVNFLTPINVTANEVDVELLTSYDSPVAYRVWENGDAGPQYFLVENRQKMGNDPGIPGSGLLIMHVDETIGGNSNENHPKVAIEQADGQFQLEAGFNSGDEWDVWSATTKDAFDDLTLPDTRKYSGQQTKTAVWDISESGTTMYANFDINYSRPRFNILSGSFSDSALGNNNGIAEEGESISFTFSVQNIWLAATNVTGTMTADNNDIIFDLPSANIGTVAGEGGQGDNFGNPIVFTIPADFTPCVDSFYLEISSDNPLGGQTIGFELHIGVPQILVIDDDNGAAWEQPLTASLLNSRIPFGLHDKSVNGSPSASLLGNYQTVMWLTGDVRADILSASDIAAMTSFLDGGGNLLLTGQSIVKELDTDDQTFLNDYLKCSNVGDKLYPIILGIDGSPVTDAIKIRFSSGTNQSDPQQIDTINGSYPAFEYSNGGYCALTYEGDYRLVLMSFGFEGISNNFVSNGYATRDSLMNRIVAFFHPGSGATNPVVESISIAGESEVMRLIGNVPVFEWDFSDTLGGPQTAYRVQVGTGDLCFNSDDIVPLAEFAGADTSYLYDGSALAEGETYVFQVQVNNGTDWSAWKKLTFHLNAVGAASVHYAPLDQAMVTTATPQLSVKNSDDPDGDELTYDFEIYADSALTVLVASATGVTSGFSVTSWTVDAPLAEDQQYFWRSRAFDGYEYNAFSAATSIWVNAVNQSPLAFVLLSPLNSDTAVVGSPEFMWQSAKDDDPVDQVLYTLRLSLDPGFVSYDDMINLIDTVALLDFALETDTAYYWKVKATDLNNGETWSTQTNVLYTMSAGCCIWVRGNINGDLDDNIDVSDLTFLVDYLFNGGPEPLCIEEANINGSAGESVDVSDLTYLVDYLFSGGSEPDTCP